LTERPKPSACASPAADSRPVLARSMDRESDTRCIEQLCSFARRRFFLDDSSTTVSGGRQGSRVAPRSGVTQSTELAAPQEPCPLNC
jgi:hypothetical protein